MFLTPVPGEYTAKAPPGCLCHFSPPSSLPLEGFAVLNDTPVACQIREPTDPQGDRWHGEAETDEVSPRSGVKLPVPPAGGVPHTPAALAATYPLRCFAPQWARFDNRHSISAPAPILSLHQRQRRKRYKQSPEPTTISAAPIPRDQHRQFCITHSAPRDP